MISTSTFFYNSYYKNCVLSTQLIIELPKSLFFIILFELFSFNISLFYSLSHIYNLMKKIIVVNTIILKFSLLRLLNST